MGAFDTNFSIIMAPQLLIFVLISACIFLFARFLIIVVSCIVLITGRCGLGFKVNQEIYEYVYGFPFSGCCAFCFFGLSRRRNFNKAGRPFFFGCTKRHRILPCVGRHPITRAAASSEAASLAAMAWSNSTCSVFSAATAADWRES